MRNFRSGELPDGVVIASSETTAPIGWTLDSSLYSKFLLQVPTAATNPGCCVGGCHTHPAEVHTHCPADFPHVHSASSSGPNLGPESGSGFPSPVAGNAPHGHGHGGTTPSSTAVASFAPSPHTHSAFDAQPTNRDIVFIKKDNTIELRQKSIPQNSFVVWSNTIATIPYNYTHSTQWDCNRFVKSIACGGTPLTTGGSADHGHSPAGGITHAITTPPHPDHGPVIFTALGSSAGPSGSGPAGGMAPRLHTHTGVKNISTVVNCGSGVTPTEGDHLHANTTNAPRFFEVSMIGNTSIDLRNKGVPNLASLLWTGTIANIPTDFSIDDGGGTTPNLIDRYVRGVASSGTDPGTTGGCHSHTHATTGTHSHLFTADHTHPASGTSGASGFGGGGMGNESGTDGGHTHTAATTASPSDTTTTVCTGDHTEASTNIRPTSKTVAFIQKDV